MTRRAELCRAERRSRRWQRGLHVRSRSQARRGAPAASHRFDALALAEEALTTARERKDHKNEAVALIELAIPLRRQNHNGAAIHHVRNAVELVETAERPLLRRAMQEAGHTFWTFGDLPTAWKPCESASAIK